MRLVAKVNEEGLAILKAKLDKFTPLLQDNVLDVLERHGSMAVERMQENHQSDAHAIQRYINRTWNLTNTIEFKVQPFVSDMARLELAANAAYAYDIENGTSRSQPYPFFWQEVYQVENDALADLQQALDEAVLAVTEHGT